MGMRVVYVAGPYRGDTPWDVECNVRQAEQATLELAQVGFAPVCPHTMYRFFDKVLPDSFWLGATLELMRRCDAVFVTDFWQLSLGARAEVADAKERGIPVFDDVTAIIDWKATV